MKIVFQMLSLAGLALTVLPAFYVFAGSITWQQHATAMLVGTILWFISAPFWMKK